MKDGSDPAFSRGDRDIGPIHVGIIMDGNGRWAAQRGLPRIEGHRRGVEALRQAVRAAPDFSIRYLTLYSFSTENWTRPPQEVSDFMALLKRFIRILPSSTAIMSASRSSDFDLGNGRYCRIEVKGARPGGPRREVELPLCPRESAHRQRNISLRCP